MKYVSKRAIGAIVAVVAIGLSSGCASGDSDARSGTPTSESDSVVVDAPVGELAGVSTEAGNRFLGIPYAQAPIDDLRWRPPQPVARWQGVRDATEFGPRCAQAKTNGGDAVDNEDCLSVNVFTPANDSTKPRPVLFWIHGGGFTSGSDSQYDGSALARTNDIVVVTINYRLGFLGFLDVPGMKDGGERNFGLLDQQAALHWTRDNVAAFGGDPGRVTIMGSSAGGHSVCAQLASPSAKGLFHGAIIESGGCPSHSEDEAVKDGMNFAVEAGCTDAGSVTNCLRSKSSQELVDASANFRGILTGPLPIAGTPELPVPPSEAVDSGRFNNVPILIGSTRNETRSWAKPFVDATREVYETEIRKEFGDNADDVLIRYPYDSYRGKYAATYALGDVWTDSGVFYGLGGCQDRKLAHRFAEQQPRTYSYRFDGENRPVDGSEEFVPGSAHSSEKPYLWPNDTTAAFSADQLKLSQAMTEYWGAFVNNADPNVTDQAPWTETSSGNIMSLRTGAASALITDEQFTSDHNCDMWDRLSYPWLDYNPAP